MTEGEQHSSDPDGFSSLLSGLRVHLDLQDPDKAKEEADRDDEE
ncbi:hypothetical protein [Streptomyces ureilyticus]|nr:hypothetical protein [Streptomyces ureilyticus]